MSTMNISLPEDMRAFIDEQVRTRGYMSASEYIRELVRHQQDVEDFRSKIRAGMEGALRGRRCRHGPPAEESWPAGMTPVRGFRYLAFYRTRGKQTDILRVLHAARDIPAGLRPLTGE